MTRKPWLGWTLDQALRCTRKIEEVVAPEFHAAMTGSCLLKGRSHKDLDVIVFPHDASRFMRSLAVASIHAKLEDAGFELLVPCKRVHENWREKGSSDTKWVDVFTYEGRRIDVFVLA